MKSGISYKQVHREVYKLDNVEQMVESQRIVYSNGFVLFGHGCEEGTLLTPSIWEPRMFLDGMCAVIYKTASNHWSWGWSRNEYGAKEYEDFKKKWRWRMNKLVIEMYPKTKDAVVVDKWFGSKLNDPLFAMLLEGKEEKLLQEAVKLEAEENAKSKK